MEINFLRNKKGELSTQQIVLLIILITSFMILLFFFVRLGLQENTEEEICHNSVLTRSSGSLGKTTPLKCHQEYICISSGSSCEQMTDPNLKKVSTKEEVYEILAEEMADCWWMFGEGKVDYVGGSWNAKNYCSICDQIAFENSLFDDSQNSIFPSGKLDKEDFYEYLSKENISEDQTYFEYLYGTDDFSFFKNKFNSESIDFGEIDLGSQYYILMGIKGEKSNVHWILEGAGTVVGITGIFLVNPAVGIVSLAIVAGDVYTSSNADKKFVGPVVIGESGNEFLSPSIIKVDPKELDALNCEKIMTLA